MNPSVYEQKFDPVWTWFMVVIAALVIVVVVAQSGENKLGLFQKISGTVVGLLFLAVIGLLVIAKLQVQIHQDKIAYRFFPFHIRWMEIQRMILRMLLWPNLTRCATSADGA